MTQNEKAMLERTAYELRKDVVNMLHSSGVSGHYGASLSCADIISVLYFKEMNIDAKNPSWPDRDRFVISKGHGCLSTYSALARLGFFPEDELWRVKHIDSILQGHPDMSKTPGIDCTSGSLGNGVSVGLGLALGVKLQGKKSHVYALVGDGECNEGVVWEMALLAGAMKADNYTVIIDYNHKQGSGTVEDIIPLEPFKTKWESFGWRVLEVNGHNIEAVADALETARDYEGQPTVIIAHTVKGKGVSFMEHNNKWHSSGISEEEYKAGIAELDEHLAQMKEA